MFRKNGLRNDTLFYGAATLAERLISFLILPILTKTLPQELYGVWTQIIVTTALLSTVVLMGFQTAAVRFLAGEKDDQGISNIFHGMLGTILLNSSIVIALTFLFAPSISNILFGNVRFSPFVNLVGFFLVGEALFELTTAFLRARKEIQLLSVYYFLKNGLRIAILGIGLLLLHIDLLQTIIFVILLQFILITLIYVKDIRKKIGFSFSFTEVHWKEICSFSFPLIPYAILIWGNNFIDRYLILHTLNINQMSIYAVAYSLAAIVGLFYSILGYTLYPYMANLWNNGDKNGAAEMLRKATEYYLFFAVPLIAILTILSTPLIKLLSTAEYLSNWQVVFWLGTGIGVFGLYQLNIYSLLLLNRTLLNLKIAVIAVVGNLTFNILLIPVIGILGAAIATFLSNSILAFWTTAIGKKYVPYVFPWRLAVRIVLATLVVSIFLLSIMHYLDMNNFFMLILVITLAVAIYGSIDLLNKNSALLQLRRGL